MIYIIRHGQTARNKAKVLQGRGSDAPLNADGCAQAREAAAWFSENGIRFDAVFTSPLIRAAQTAEIVSGGVPAVTDLRLIEMDYGPYEGADLSDPPAELVEFFRDLAHNPAPEGMEPLPEIVARAGSFLEEIRGEARTKTILVATHAIAMKGLLEYLTPGSDGAYWPKFIANCAVCRAEILPDGSYSVPEEVFSPGAGYANV